MTLLFRNRSVALVTLVTILGEVLGFSSLTLFPTFARDVLHTDAAGLGAMTAARSIGGIGGAIALASGARSRDGALLLVTTGVFGLSLVVFAASSVLLLSIGILIVVGGAMAALDTWVRRSSNGTSRTASEARQWASGTSPSGSGRSGTLGSARPRRSSARRSR